MHGELLADPFVFGAFLAELVGVLLAVEAGQERAKEVEFERAANKWHLWINLDDFDRWRRFYDRLGLWSS